MKHNKHIHDEDYDINIKLMVPLLSMLVCTICLCATTWAWYTASVFTGVNSIVAGANVKETVTYGENCTECILSSTDGMYLLEPNKTYVVTFKPEGNVAKGYYALIDITNESTNKSTPETALQTLFGLFVNRVYAEGSGIKGHVYINNNDHNTTSIKITVDSKKELKIQYIWKVDENIENDLGEEYKDYKDSVFSTSAINSIKNNTINNSEVQSSTQTTVTFNFINAETGEPLPYSALGIETYGLSENEELPQTAAIVLEADLEEYEIFAPNGYLLKLDESRGETEDQESRIYTLEPGKDAVINVSCVVRPESNPNQNTGDLESSSEQNTNEVINDNPSVNQDPISQSNNETTSDNDLNQENGVPSQGSTEGTTETDTSESGVPPTDGNNEENLAEDPSGSSLGNNESSTTPEQETGTSTSKTVESLLLTENTSNEETSSDSQSTDISSSTDTSSETESNVSE